MLDLVVGCPVSHRAWILPCWHEHVEAAAERAAAHTRYVFVASPSDEETLAAIDATMPSAEVVVHADDRAGDVRDWGPRRYVQMVALRQALLDRVRKIAPPLFLSLDSDILLHPAAITNLVESASLFDAVGGLTFMTPSGTSCPSWGTWSRTGIRRGGAPAGVFAAHVIMAIKLMAPRSYSVDYEFHQHGEDLGWSKACGRQGVRLGVDTRVANKHVMRPAMLDRVDPRCGF